MGHWCESLLWLCIIHKEGRFFDPPFSQYFIKEHFSYFISVLYSFFPFILFPNNSWERRLYYWKTTAATLLQFLYRSIFNLPKALRHLLPPSYLFPLPKFGWINIYILQGVPLKWVRCLHLAKMFKNFLNKCLPVLNNLF